MTATRTKFTALLATTAATGLALTGFVFAAVSPASAGSDPCTNPMYRLHIDDQGAFTGDSTDIGVRTNKPHPSTPGTGTLWAPNGPNVSSIMICTATFHNLDGSVHEDDTHYTNGTYGSYDSASGYSGADFTAADIPASQPTPTPSPTTPAPTTTAPPTSSPTPTSTPTMMPSSFAVAKVAADSTTVRRSGHIGVTSRNLRPGRAVKVFEERVSGGKTVSTKKGQATVNKYGTTRFSFVPDNVAGKAKVVVIGADTAGKPVKVTFAITVK